MTEAFWSWLLIVPPLFWLGLVVVAPPWTTVAT